MTQIPSPGSDRVPVSQVEEKWRAAWPSALAVWSRFTRLQSPEFCTSRGDAAREGLTGSFAMIRFADQRIVIDLETVSKLRLEDYGLEVLAHEIGHHVYAPANSTDHFRLLARIRKALPTLEAHAPRVANLYTDLFINDRLQRQGGLRIGDVYQRMHQAAEGKPQGELWTLYLRIYENLWKLERGSLGARNSTDKIETDAWLGSRLIRVFANEWMDGAGRFASLLLPYLVNEQEALDAIAYLQDTLDAAEGCEPQGAHTVEDDEEDGAIHPAEDPRISGVEESGAGETTVRKAVERSRGQARQPFEYGEILKAAGVKLSDHEIAVRYYRERALPHLVPFPSRPSPDTPEPMPEGLEPWDIGDPLDEIDWLESVLISPRIIPGMTAVKRILGQMQGQIERREPVDLDLYVDSSGSMPNPQVNISYLTLAGAIIALSALRAGSRVQVTLWSGKNQVTQTDGFVRGEEQILRVLTGFYCGATCFPIHCLRETYGKRTNLDRPVHILMISDDGITTMFDNDEQGNSGWDVSALALAKGRAGGTMVLQLGGWVMKDGNPYGDKIRVALDRAAREHTWAIEPIDDWEQLMGFARRFAQRHYGQPQTAVAQRAGAAKR